MNSVTSTPLNNDYYTGYAVFLAFCLDFQYYSKVFGFSFLEMYSEVSPTFAPAKH